MTIQTKALALAPAFALLAAYATADVPGIGRAPGDATTCVGNVCTFNLTARAGHITLGDGNQLLAWGYGSGAAQVVGEHLDGDAVLRELPRGEPRALEVRARLADEHAGPSPASWAERTTPSAVP